MLRRKYTHRLYNRKTALTLVVSICVQPTARNYSFFYNHISEVVKTVIVIAVPLDNAPIIDFTIRQAVCTERGIGGVGDGLGDIYDWAVAAGCEGGGLDGTDVGVVVAGSLGVETGRVIVAYCAADEL
jgi:hypothetical protein